MDDDIRVEFPGTRGVTLVGRLRLPLGPVRAYVLLAHCFTCGKDLRIGARISRRMAEQGFGVLRFDFTGLGESEGDFADSNFSSNIDDLKSAAAYLRDKHSAPAILVGHSLGGAAVLAAAEGIPEAVAVATIGAPAEAAHVRGLLQNPSTELARDGQAAVCIAGRPFNIRAQFLEDLEAHCDDAHIGALGRALLVMHSPQDNVVGIENATKIFSAARHPRSFISLDGADHLLSRPADADYAGLAIAAWAGRYLPAATDDQVAARDQAASPPDHAVRAALGPDGLGVELTVGGHRMRADEPVDMGGRDTGPSPYGYLLAALGACTAMTLQMYARRKGWPLESVDVSLEHERVHADDCADCERSTGRIDIIHRHLELSGALDDAQRAGLLRIADRCPVHRTLENEIRVRTTGG